MALLVKFIAVENKTELEHEEYVNKIYQSLCSAGLIKSVMLSPEDLMGRESPVIEGDEEGNIFAIYFNSVAMNQSDNWEVYFCFGTYNDVQQLEITIQSDTYTVEPINDSLEKLKFGIKKSIVKDWNTITWLIDKDSECLSFDLYILVYKIENSLRELINEVMIKQYGTKWWDLLIPYDMKEKHRARLKEYKAKIRSFNNVDDRLMAIDIDDLGKILTLIRYRWTPVYSEEINGLINGVQRCVDSKLRELLEEQRTEDVNLWKEHFSRYLPEDFLERFGTFSKDRNHVMHNKLLDRMAYHTMKELAERIEMDLMEALRKQRELLPSDEEKRQIERQQQMERRMLEEADHICRENDAGVSIRTIDEIRELFEESVSELVTDLTEELRFREDIEIEEDDTSLSEDKGPLLWVESKIDAKRLYIAYNLWIVDDEGADSVLQLLCKGEFSDFCESINYKNAEVELDEESGLYVPVLQDELSDVDDVVEALYEFIESELRDYCDVLSPEDLAESLPCNECGEEYICINEEALPVGTCANCGYVNEIYQCDRCGEWFNAEWDGSRDADGVSFCQNCLDYMETE